MANKKGENVFIFDKLVGILLLTLVAAVVYLRRDINWNIVKEQITQKQQPVQDNNITIEQEPQNVEKQEEQTPYDCDYFSGEWVYDNLSYPSYNKKCSFIDDRVACEKFGRTDLKYQHWRWQPDHCDIPRFNGAALLEKLRGKKLYFVGDSLNRNQWMSFLCLIDSSLPPSSKKSVTLTGNWHIFQQEEYNMTIAFYWSPYLVESNCDDEWHFMMGDRLVKVNDIEKHAQQWNDADILVFDTYAWWLTFSRGSFGNSDFTNGLRDGMRLRRYEMALSTWSDWLEIHINRTKTKLFFMGASPFNRGPRAEVAKQCFNKSEPIPREGYPVPDATNHDMVRVQESIIQKLETRGLKVQYLPITEMSELRVDAHAGLTRAIYYRTVEDSYKDPMIQVDCVHWCLPGVPDTWNQILNAYIMNS